MWWCKKSCGFRTVCQGKAALGGSQQTWCLSRVGRLHAVAADRGRKRAECDTGCTERTWTSMWLVGSSKMRTSGLPRSAAATATLRACPPDIASILMPGFCMPTVFNTLLALASSSHASRAVILSMAALRSCRRWWWGMKCISKRTSTPKKAQQMPTGPHKMLTREPHKPLREPVSHRTVCTWHGAKLNSDQTRHVRMHNPGTWNHRPPEATC